MSKECPCKGCVPPKRNPTCHSGCPDYKEWRAEKDNENEKIKKAREEQKMLDDFFFIGLEKGTLAKKKSKGKGRRQQKR